jgi:hypothetical protein
MPLEQRDAVYLIAVTSIDFNVSYEPYAGRSNCKTPSVRKTTKREHWKCAKSFQPDWNTCVLWEGDLNDRSYESGIAGDHAYPNACEKKHAVIMFWEPEGRKNPPMAHSRCPWRTGPAARKPIITGKIPKQTWSGPRTKKMRETTHNYDHDPRGSTLTLAVSSSLISATQRQNHWIWGESRV